MKVLVTEDDKALSKAYQLKLNGKGYDVRMAFNGEEALRILDEFHPDIIILDLLMPVMDGFETLKALREKPESKDIPIIVATNLAQTDDVIKAMELGATDYIVKTDFSTRDLIEKIESHVNKHATAPVPKTDQPLPTK